MHNHVAHTCSLLTSTGGLTRCFIIVFVSISVTASISKLLTCFIIGIIIKLWEKSSTWSSLGFWRTVSSLCVSCVSWETYIKHNTYNSVTARTWPGIEWEENVGKIFCDWFTSKRELRLFPLTSHLLKLIKQDLFFGCFRNLMLYDCFYFRPGCIKWPVSVYFSSLACFGLKILSSLFCDKLANKLLNNWHHLSILIRRAVSFL